MGALRPITTAASGAYLVPDDTLHVLHVSDLHYGPAGTQNRDEAPVGSGATDPDTRMVAALAALPGTAHPLGGVVRAPDVIIVTGDNVHEGSESTLRYERDYPSDRVLEVDGNHDRNPTRDMIVRRHGSLNWGRKVKHVYFQALTERYVSELDNGPPTAAQLASVQSLLSARSPRELTVFLVHRSMTGGYAPEWDRTAATTTTEALDNSEPGVDVASTAGLSVGTFIQVDNEEMEITAINGLTLTVARAVSRTTAAPHNLGATVYRTTALDALKALCDSRRTLCILNGHDHATRHETWRGVRVFSPGSVTQGPMLPPYASFYPEAINVLRIGLDTADAANYNFGYDATAVNPRNWNPGTWNWAEAFPVPA